MHEPSFDEPSDKDVELIRSVASALDDLPITARLKFVKNLIFDHGGAKGAVPQDSKLVISVEVLSGIIDELERGPIGSRAVGAGPEPT